MLWARAGGGTDLVVVIAVAQPRLCLLVPHVPRVWVAGRRPTLDGAMHALQVVEEGYEFFARRQLVTIFSAPNYCGEFDNAGAMMSVDDTLMCSFQVSACGLGAGRGAGRALAARSVLKERSCAC